MGAGIGVSDNGDGITVGSSGPGSVGEIPGEADATGEGLVMSFGIAVGDAIGDAAAGAPKRAVALDDGDEPDSLGVGETDEMGVADTVGDAAGEASTVSDIIGDGTDDGVAIVAAGLGDGVAESDGAATGDGVSRGVGALVRIAFGGGSLCGLCEVLGVDFGDGVGAAVGTRVGVGEAVGLSAGLGVGEGCSHAIGQCTDISVAVWPARALSMLAAGSKSPFAGSNSSALAKGL